MPQNSVVIELQRLASDSTANTSDVLRKALLVATKLKVVDFKTWVEAELRGYVDPKVKLPAYRVIYADIRALNPYRGLIPVQMTDSATERYYARAEVRNALPELEDMVKLPKGQLVQKLPPEHYATGIHAHAITFDLYRVIARNHVIGIVESVRTMILEWALKLEGEGILGEEMTFSESDKEKAARSQRIHIGNFQGVLGDVSAQNFQIGNYASIHNQLKEAGVSQKERNELENILDQLKKADGAQEREPLLKRGLNWVTKNATKLGALSTAIRAWFQ
jgi:hypothetical protein